MTRLLALLFVLVAGVASAQTSRTITVVPIKFQNDLREPQTVQQIRDWWGILSGFTDNATNGLMRLDIIVLPYITIPIDRQYGMTGANQDLGCYQNFATRTPWTSAALTAARNAGHAVVGQSWVYSPQTFGMCSEVDRLGYMVDGRNYGFMYAQMLGLSSFMPAWTTICTDASGAFVTLSTSCRFDNRTFQSLTGQGNGAFTCAERATLGTMPAARTRTLAVGATLPQTFTVTPIEQVPVGDEIQCLTIQAYGVGITPIGTVSGITFELHKRTPWSDEWQTAGLSGHITNTSRLLDFTPDGKVVWSGQGGTGTLNPGQSFTMNGVRVSVGNFTATGTVPVTVSAAGSTPTPTPEPLPPPPPPPQNCAVSANGAFVQSLTVSESGACVTYQISNGGILRNGAYVGEANALIACDGIAHARQGSTVIYRRSGSTWVLTTLPAGCVGGTTQPPPPPTWTVVPGTIERDSAGALRLTIDGVTFGVVRQP
jgi:hypothetical protein